MNREQLIEFVGKYGFTLWATERIKGKTEYHFMERRYGINLWVNLDALYFRFEWKILNTMFLVICPECSPITDGEHFKRTYQRFKKSVRTIKREAEDGE